MDKIRLQVVQIVATHFDIEPEKVSMDTNFELDLGADSVDLIMFVIEIENHYGIVIPDDLLTEVFSPQKIIEVIKQKL